MTKLIEQKKAAGSFVVRTPLEAMLVFDKQTYEKTIYFVEHSPIECMWYSTIERIQNVSIKPHQFVYKISDILIPHQTAAAAEVEATPTELMNMWKAIQTERNLTAAELNTLMSESKFWGHSHVNMSPTPSPVDNEAWRELLKAAKTSKNTTPLGMIILNKAGTHTSRVYDPIEKVEFENLSIYVQDSVDYDYVQNALDIKIKAKPTAPSPTAPSPIVQPTPKNAQPTSNSYVYPRQHPETKESVVYKTAESSIEVYWDECTESLKKNFSEPLVKLPPAVLYGL